MGLVHHGLTAHGQQQIRHEVGEHLVVVALHAAERDDQALDAYAAMPLGDARAVQVRHVLLDLPGSKGVTHPPLGAERPQQARLLQGDGVVLLGIRERAAVHPQYCGRGLHLVQRDLAGIGAGRGDVRRDHRVAARVLVG